MSFTRPAARLAAKGHARSFAPLLIGAAFVSASIPRAALAKPQIACDCSPSCGGYNTSTQALSYLLYYNSANSGESTWNNYVSVDVYNGATHISGPTDDPNAPYQRPQVGDPCANGSGSNCSIAVAASAGYTIVLNVSGEWNTTTCSTTVPGVGPPCGFYCTDQCGHCLPFCCNYNVSCNMGTLCCGRAVPPNPNDFVWSEDPVPVTGHSRWFDVNLDIVRPPSGSKNWAFTYALFKRSNLGDHITPLKESGSSTAFYRLRQNHNQSGQSQKVYSVSAGSNDPFVAGDLRINLAGLANPPSASDYVYLDVFARNLTDGTSYPMPRILVQIPNP